MRPTSLLPITLTSLLIACTPPDDASKPITAITAPASDASITGTVPIQIDARDDQTINKVEVFARGRGSKAQGYLVGSAVSAPYVISWDSAGSPNGEFELVAMAEDAAGNKGASTPLRVKVSNANAPSLNYLIAYNLPQKPAEFAGKSLQLTASSLKPFTLSNAASSVLPMHTLSQLNNLQPPTTSNLEPSNLVPSSTTPSLKALAEAPRTLALEWSWQAFQSIGSIAGADGYSVWYSNSDLAGPYSRVANPAASTAGTQKLSKDYADARVGDTVFGAIKAVTNNRTTETGFSNADGATFPRAQEAAAPANGSSVNDGRPVLTWTPTPGVRGYLYFVFDKNPWDPTAKLLWGNSPRTTDQLSATYPIDRAPLPSGSYYWWVSGVTFDSLEKADAFSFSEPMKFIVP